MTSSSPTSRRCPPKTASRRLVVTRTSAPSADTLDAGIGLGAGAGASYPGKPPHRRAIVEAHVRNPLASPVWLLYDIGDELPSIINRVTVSRTSPQPGAHVWSFHGDGGFEAVRLPPGADLVLCELELNADSGEEPFLLAFATSITIGDRPAESWAGQAGLSPASGDFRVTRPLMAFERKVDGLGAAPLVASILCVKRFDEDTTPVEPTCGAKIDR